MIGYKGLGIKKDNEARAMHHPHALGELAPKLLPWSKLRML